jgi:hypothetical protein
MGHVLRFHLINCLIIRKQTRSLVSNLELADDWKALLLLDEADVFLQARH